MKLQQRGLHQSWRLLSTNTETHSARPKDKEVDTLISSLPYDTLAYDPHLYSYDSLISHIEEFIEKGVPFFRPFFCRLMRLLDKQGHIDHDEAAILLDSTGIANVYFPDDKKAEFTRCVWNKIQNNGLESVKKDINLFNLYMKVLLENKAPLTPIEIEAEIQDRQLTPNRITYQMKIASACERGDLSEVREQLKEIMRLNYPISTSLYNTLILGYCKAGCIDKAEEMLQSMGKHGLEADNLTYGNFMLGCAERGDIDNIKKYIEDSGQSLDPHSSLEIVVLLAKNGYSVKAYQVLDILKEKIKPNVLDATWAVTSLLHSRHYRLAFKLNSLLGVRSGRFFGVYAVVSNMPVDLIVKFMRQSRQLKHRKCDLLGLVKAANFCGEFDTASELCNHLYKTDVLEINQLTFSLHYHCENGQCEDILRLQPHIERMTIWHYAPALKIMYTGLRRLGKTSGDAVQILRDNNNLDEGEFNAAMIRTLLITEPLHIAKAEVEKMEALDNIFLLAMFKSPLIEMFLQKADDWREVFEFVAELKKKRKSELNCCFVVKTAMELLLKEGMSLEPLIDFMIKNQLKVFDFASDIYAPGVSSEKLKQIEIDRVYLEQRQYTQELEQGFPEDSKVLNHHLQKAACNMDRRSVESILASKDFRRIPYIDRDAKSSVIAMYANLCDADSVLFHTSELIHTPDRDGRMYHLSPHLALKIAVALWKEDRCEEALDILSKLRVLDWDRIKEKKKVECNRFLRQLLSHDQNQNFKNRLVDVLVKNNFLKRTTENSPGVYSMYSVNTSNSKK